MTSYIKAKNRGIKIRMIAEITSDSLPYSKKMMSFAEVRHIDGIIGSFGVSEREYISVNSSPLGTIPQQPIHSTMKVFVQQQQYFFNTLWNKAIPVEQKIEEIEKGIKPEKIETMTDLSEIETKYIQILEKATDEILLIFPTLNSMRRQFHIGIVQVLKKKYSSA
jgi:two-component system, OmpR family, sensor histidine kinase VicK